MKKVIATVPLVAAAALLSATPAMADVAYMTGLFGANVDYASIAAPPGRGCDPGAGCDLIPYANFSVNAASLRRGVRVQLPLRQLLRQVDVDHLSVVRHLHRQLR